MALGLWLGINAFLEYGECELPLGSALVDEHWL